MAVNLFTGTLKHPAKYTNVLIPIFAEMLEGTNNVLDPMAGTGKLLNIKQYGYRGDVYLNELEPEWAFMTTSAKAITTLDAADLPYKDNYFDAICTSPVYGNRMSDHHNARDGSKRTTYKHFLGRDLHPENTGAMHWGEKYRTKHEAIWQECKRILRPRGILILNISDHICEGKQIYVSKWHQEYLMNIGFDLLEARKVNTPRMREGANSDLRVEYEWVMKYVKK